MGGALDSNCWSGKILMSFFLGLYIIGEVSTAFSLLNEGFFLMLVLTRRVAQVQELSSAFQPVWLI